MSGLLQKLAGQVMGMRGVRPPQRVRAAMSVHAQQPLSFGEEAAMSEPQAGATEITAVPAAPVVRPLTAPEAADPGSRRAVSAPAGRTDVVELRARQSNEALRDPTHQQTTALGARTSAGESDAPPNLLDEVAPVSVAPPPRSFPVANARESAAAQMAVRSEPTEVHVHIGRIEVTTLPEAGIPRKARTQPTRQTQSLAQYLSRKRPA